MHSSKIGLTNYNNYIILACKQMLAFNKKKILNENI